MQMSFKRLNYIGCKYKLLSFIKKTIQENTDITDFNGKKIVDVFSGTGCVSNYFTNLGSKVISNDLEYYAYVIAYANNCSTYTDKIKGLIDELNNAENTIGLLSLNYSELGPDKRKFFTKENAQKIDGARTLLEEKKESLSDNEYFFLLASIIVSADKIANVPAVYGAFLKKFKKKAKEKFKIEPVHQEETKDDDNSAFNLDCEDLTNEIENADVVYMDPPYNERQYCKNYHVLNFLAKYDDSIEIYGKTGLIKNSITSEWCSKSKAPLVLDRMMQKLVGKSSYVMMSYNNEGIISHEKIREIMEKYFEVELVETIHRRFKNFNYNAEGTTKEYIWIGKAI